MASTFVRKIAGLDLEEKILNTAAALCVAGIFIPWVGGQMLTSDQSQMYNGFSFLTGLIGWAVFALHVFILLLTVGPLTSKGSLVRKDRKHAVRLQCASAGSILILAALSVLLKITFEFPLMEIRFGVHISLLGSIATTFYAFLTWQQSNKSAVQELFHHESPPTQEVEPPLVIAQEETHSPIQVHHVPPPPPPEEQESGI